jgi:hypothetical protein
MRGDENEMQFKIPFGSEYIIVIIINIIIFSNLLVENLVDKNECHKKFNSLLFGLMKKFSAFPEQKDNIRYWLLH